MPLMQQIFLIGVVAGFAAFAITLAYCRAASSHESLK